MSDHGHTLARSFRAAVLTVAKEHLQQYCDLTHVEKLDFAKYGVEESYQTFLLMFDNVLDPLTSDKQTASDTPAGTSASQTVVDIGKLQSRNTALTGQKRTAEQTALRKLSILLALQNECVGLAAHLDKIKATCDSFCIQLTKPSINADLSKMCTDREIKRGKRSPVQVNQQADRTTELALCKGHSNGKYSITEAGKQMITKIAEEFRLMTKTPSA
jgi:hypothetical protein